MSMSFENERYKMYKMSTKKSARIGMRLVTLA